MADPGFIHENLNKQQQLENSTRTIVSEMEFQASQVIERLEEAAEKAAEAVTGSPGGQAWKSMHGVLPLPCKMNAEIFRVLEDLMTYEDNSSLTEWAGAASKDEEESASTSVPPPPPLASIPALDGVAKLAVVSQSLAALGAALDRTHCHQLNSRLANDCTRWLSHLFRFRDCAALFHEDPLEGIVRITRLMLHYKYPKYQEDGYEALSSSPPVIYSSIASPLGVVQHLCRQLGLPLRCVHPVPCNTLFGSQQKMDVSELERLMDVDEANNQKPLIVLADAGTIIAGHVDSLARLQEVCEKRDVWLHLRGHNLAALTLSTPPVLAATKQLKFADSLTLPIGTWLGVPALPIVTLYRPCRSPETDAAAAARESTLPLIAGLVNDSSARRLISLPLWTTLQALGRDGIQGRIRQAFESSEIVWKAISKYPCLSLLSQKPGGEAGAFSVAEIVSKPVNTTVLLEVVACTVVFQFVPQNNNEGERSGRVPPYYDKLNTWLGHILQQECPQLVIDLCELEFHGVVLRYCPLELSVDNLPTQEDIDHFISCLEQQLDVLTATVQLKEVFHQTVAQCNNLQLVQDMADWAGLGGVRYVPDGWELLQPTQGRQELNRLNIQLVERLQSTDQAFSLGEDSEGMAYVRFGMVTAGSDVEELLELVLSVGKEVEESSRFLETMTQVVKKGIEAATLDLQKENEERLWQEGILRQVPVVGSFVNWWSPRSKEGGIKGRSLNLNAGVVESTENIYRYHMQLQGGSGASGAPGTRVTPTPMVQTPVGAVSGNQHSRSSSQASQTSQVAATPPPSLTSLTSPAPFSSNIATSIAISTSVAPTTVHNASDTIASASPVVSPAMPSELNTGLLHGDSSTVSLIAPPGMASSSITGVTPSIPSSIHASVSTPVK